MKTRKTKPRSSLQRMVRALALALATEYAKGWKAHLEWVNEPTGMPAEMWGECNWQNFTAQAEDILRPNE